MLLLRVPASTGHFRGGNLQRNRVITNVKDVHTWSICYIVFLCKQSP